MSDKKKLTEAEKRLWQAMFGDGEVDKEERFDGHYYCIMCEPLDADDAPSWFAAWIKYRDDAPEAVKRWLEDAGVEPGESAPMFTSGGEHRPGARPFRYKGMAEKTAEKIAEMYPDLKGKMHIMVYEEASGEE